MQMSLIKSRKNKSLGEIAIPPKMISEFLKGKTIKL